MTVSRKTLKLLILLIALLLPTAALTESKTQYYTGAKKERALKKIKVLEKKHAKDPGNIKRNFALGVLYHRVGNIEKALSYLKKTNEDPTVQTLKYLANVLNEHGDHLEEVRVLGILISKRPHSPNFHTKLADAYSKIEQPDKAIEHYKIAIEKYKKHKPAWNGLINVYRAQNNAYELRLLLGDMTKLFKDDVEPFTALCELDLQESFLEAAINVCRKAIELDHSIAANHVYLGLAYKFQKNEARANKIIIGAAKRFQKSEFAQFEAGQISEEQKNWEAARKYYFLGTKAYQESARSHLGVARTLLNLKNFDKSLEYYLIACKLDRSSYDELLKAVGKLRTEGQDKWYSEFRAAKSKCGIQ